MTLDPCAVSLSEEVEKLSGMVRPSAAVRGVAFTLRMQDITQDIVVTDPLRLRQVLINPLTNAVKYDGSIMAFFEGDVPFYVCNAECVSGMKKRESKSETFHAAPFEYEFLYALLGDSGAYVYLESWTASRSARTATRPSWPSSSSTPLRATPSSRCTYASWRAATRITLSRPPLRPWAARCAAPASWTLACRVSPAPRAHCNRYKGKTTTKVPVPLWWLADGLGVFGAVGALDTLGDMERAAVGVVDVVGDQD